MRISVLSSSSFPHDTLPIIRRITVLIVSVKILGRKWQHSQAVGGVRLGRRICRTEDLMNNGKILLPWNSPSHWVSALFFLDTSSLHRAGDRTIDSSQVLYLQFHSLERVWLNVHGLKEIRDIYTQPSPSWVKALIDLAWEPWPCPGVGLHLWVRTTFQGRPYLPRGVHASSPVMGLVREVLLFISLFQIRLKDVKLPTVTLLESDW